MANKRAVERPKIALVGPALPYRSGIARYTTHMQAALASRADTQTFSFKRQYPKWLYPGNDTAPDVVSDAVPDTTYTIDVYNPFSWRRTAKSIVDEGYEVVILSWWTLFWQPGLGYIQRYVQKRGVKTVYLCHNLFDHKTGGMMGLANVILGRMSRWLLQRADAYIVQSSQQEAELLELKPSAVLLRRMHPITAQPIVAKKILPKRGRLELLFFGLIRPYKGLETLLQALEGLKDSEVYVTIAGEPWGDDVAVRERLATAKIANLETHLEYVSDEAAAQYFARADAVVLPYRAATGSAVVALAYAYDKPAIATRVSGLVDAIIDGKTGYLVDPASSSALATGIHKTSRKELASLAPNIKEFCATNSWDAMAEAVVDFSGQLLDRN